MNINSRFETEITDSHKCTNWYKDYQRWKQTFSWNIFVWTVLQGPYSFWEMSFPIFWSYEFSESMSGCKVTTLTTFTDCYFVLGHTFSVNTDLTKCQRHERSVACFNANGQLTQPYGGYGLWCAVTNMPNQSLVHETQVQNQKVQECGLLAKVCRLKHLRNSQSFLQVDWPSSSM